MKNKTALIDHLNFTVSDFEESTKWYEKVFHFQLVEQGIDSEGKKWGILRSGDSLIAITEAPGRTQSTCEEHHKIYHFGIRLKDAEEWQTTLKENALPTYYNSPISYPYSKSWYVKDPSGHEIEVSVWENDKLKFDHL